LPVGIVLTLKAEDIVIFGKFYTARRTDKGKEVSQKDYTPYLPLLFVKRNTACLGGYE
jgi:alpha-acetolactate decarboxylase